MKLLILALISTFYVACSPAPRQRDCISVQTEAEWIIGSSKSDSVKVIELKKLYDKGYR